MQGAENMPTVSVIIPTYKHQDYVLKALDSVFAQSFTDYEVIVVNDGSPDNTEAVLRPLAESGRIGYIAQENAGQSAARNRGIAEAEGEFIALLDDDDLWPPDKLAWQVQALRANPDVALVYGRVQVVNGDGDPWTPVDDKGEPLTYRWMSPGPSGDVYEAFLDDNYIVSPGQCLLRRSCLDSLGKSPFNPKTRGGSDDWELYLRLAQQFPFIQEDRVSILYRLHSANASNNVAQVLLSILSVRRAMAETETDPARRDKGQARYREFALSLVVKALLSFSDPDLRKSGWTRPVAHGCLRDLAGFLPAALPIYLRIRLGALKRGMLSSQ